MELISITGTSTAAANRELATTARIDVKVNFILGAPVFLVADEGKGSVQEICMDEMEPPQDSDKFISNPGKGHFVYGL